MSSEEIVDESRVLKYVYAVILDESLVLWSTQLALFTLSLSDTDTHR